MRIGRTQLASAQRRLDVLARVLHDYHHPRLSQTAIAGALDVSQPAVSKALRRTSADDPAVRRAAAALGWILITKHGGGGARAHTCGHIL